jgi:4-amino-4-deoxy-L-arabinose transferase-like glycosyltransferase
MLLAFHLVPGRSPRGQFLLIPGGSRRAPALARDCASVMSEAPTAVVSEESLSCSDVGWLLLVSVPLFIGLGGGLHGSEARWLFVSQEMLRTGNWLEPRILGEFYGDKPLLSYWLIALLATPFGVVDETLGRLPSAFAAAGVVWLTGRCAAPLLGRRPAVFASFVVATAFSVIVWARSACADLDSLFFSTAAVAVYLETTRRARRWHAPLFFSLLALGGHAKGMPAVAVPLAVASTDALLSGRVAAFALRWRELLLGAALGADLYLVPFVASRITRGDWELLHLVWIENFVRAFAAFDHTASVFYYVYTLPAMLLPWGLWLPGALLSASVRRDRSAGERFALTAFCVTFALFTLSQSRRSYYILPIFPWCALLIAAYWDRLARAPDARSLLTRCERVFGLWPATALAGALCGAGVLLVLGHWVPGELHALVAALPGALAVGFAALGVGGWLLRALGRRDLRAATVALAAAGLVGSAVYATSVRAALDGQRVERSFAAEVKQRFPGQPIVYYGSTSLVLRWYLEAGTLAGSPEQLAQLLDATGSRDLMVVCGKAGARCLDGVNGLLAETLIDRWSPAVSRFVPSKSRFTLLRVQRSWLRSFESPPRSITAGPDDDLTWLQSGDSCQLRPGPLDALCLLRLHSESPLAFEPSERPFQMCSLHDADIRSARNEGLARVSGKEARDPCSDLGRTRQDLLRTRSSWKPVRRGRVPGRPADFLDRPGSNR